MKCNRDVCNYNIQTATEKVTCNAQTGLFIDDITMAIACDVYDVTCGDIDVNFDLGPGVQHTCVYYQENVHRSFLNI